MKESKPPPTAPASPTPFVYALSQSADVTVNDLIISADRQNW
ncbi:hypothetical protein ABT072_44040 [Streptomyces sp. NPDC002589]